MRALLTLLLLVPSPALGQAQAFVDEDGAPLPWPQPLVFEAPVLLVTDTLWADALSPYVTVSAQGADGRRVRLFEPSARSPARVFHANGWIELTRGCGGDCFYSYLVDRDRGRVAGPLALVLDVDVVHDRVAAVGADGLVVLDPFDPASARSVSVPVDLGRFASPLGGLRGVAFELGQEALAVTVVGPYGEEESYVVPLDAAVLTTLPDPERP